MMSSRRGLRPFLHNLLRKLFCSRMGHKWRVSRDGTSFCRRCRLAMR